MDSRKVILLVGALVVAAITAFMARTLIMGTGAPQAAAVPGAPAAVPAGPKVLVATRALPVGTIIDPGAVKFQPWPAELVEGAYFQESGDFDMKNVLGTVVRNTITAGQPITQGALVKPGLPPRETLQPFAFMRMISSGSTPARAIASQRSPC